MTEQSPYTVFVATPERRKNKSPEFGDQRYEFATPSEKKIFGFTEERTDRTKFNISSREKTIVNCPAHPECCGWIPEVARAMRNARREVDWNKAPESAGTTEINVVLQRLGCLLPVPEIEDAIAKSAAARTRRHPNQYLDPGAAKKRIGSSREYGLPVNRTGEELLGRIDCR